MMIMFIRLLFLRFDAYITIDLVKYLALSLVREIRRVKNDRWYILTNKQFFLKFVLLWQNELHESETTPSQMIVPPFSFRLVVYQSVCNLDSFTTP